MVQRQKNQQHNTKVQWIIKKNLHITAPIIQIYNKKNIRKKQTTPKAKGQFIGGRDCI